LGGAGAVGAWLGGAGAVGAWLGGAGAGGAWLGGAGGGGGAGTGPKGCQLLFPTALAGVSAFELRARSPLSIFLLPRGPKPPELLTPGPGIAVALKPSVGDELG
jgi:hypothetical protein